MDTDDEKHVVSHYDVTSDDLGRIRADATEFGRLAGLDDERAGRFALAVHEAAANSIEHADNSGEITLVRDDHLALYADVSDTGPGFTDSALAALPPADSPGGRGLWLSGHLSDHMRIDSGPDGTRVHLEMAVGDEDTD